MQRFVVFDGGAVGKIADALEGDEGRAACHFEQSGLVLAGGKCLNHAFAAGNDNAIVPLQQRIERLACEVGGEDAGAECVGQPGGDKHNRLVVDRAQAVDDKHGRVDSQPQRFGYLGVGGRHLLLQDSRYGALALAFHILVEAGQFLKEAFADFGAGNKGALPLAAHDQPFILHAHKRLAHDGAAHVEELAEVRLAGQLVAGQSRAVLDGVADRLLHLSVERDIAAAIDARVELHVSLRCCRNAILVSHHAVMTGCDCSVLACMRNVKRRKGVHVRRFHVAPYTRNAARVDEILV